MRARNLLRTAAALLLASSMSLAAPAAQADVYVVVPAASNVKAMSQKEVLDLYMGRTRAFPAGGFAVPFDLPRDNPGRAAFYQALTGMGLAQINSYWSRLMFSGQTMPPQALPGEVEMADLVRHNSNAIGYLSQEPAADQGLRVVLVLKPSR